MIGATLLVAACLLQLTGAPWWALGLVAPPALVLGAGEGFGRWLDRGGGTGLSRALDAAWVGLLLTWVDVALCRELGCQPADLLVFEDGDEDETDG